MSPVERRMLLNQTYIMRALEIILRESLADMPMEDVVAAGTLAGAMQTHREATLELLRPK